MRLEIPQRQLRRERRSKQNRFYATYVRPGANFGRAVLAVLAGYIANAILVAASEALLSRLTRGATPLSYFVVDLFTQCIYTIVGGYICRQVARSSTKAPLGGLISLAMLMGTISLVTSWKSEPHWYGIALLAVYPPCAWVGWRLKEPANT